MNNKDKENLLNAYMSIYIKEEAEMTESEPSEETSEESESESSEEDAEDGGVEVATEEYKK